MNVCNVFKLYVCVLMNVPVQPGSSYLVCSHFELRTGILRLRDDKKMTKKQVSGLIMQ